MSRRVRYTSSARDDIKRLYGFLLEADIAAAKHALAAVIEGVAMLRQFPFSCRKADPADPFLRELLIPFGTAGYVVLYEISDEHTITILALRHQREDDYH